MSSDRPRFAPSVVDPSFSAARPVRLRTAVKAGCANPTMPSSSPFGPDPVMPDPRDP